MNEAVAKWLGAAKLLDVAVQNTPWLYDQARQSAHAGAARDPERAGRGRGLGIPCRGLREAGTGGEDRDRHRE